MDIKRIGERAHMRAMDEGVDKMNNTDMQAAASAIRGMYCMLKETDCLTAELEPLKVSDSWERLAEDSQMTPSRYCERYGIEPLLGGKVCAMMADIVVRARELGEAGEEDE